MRARKVKRRSKTSRVGATSERASSARKQFLVEIAIALFLAAIVWLAFGQTLHNGFVSYDDGDYVYKNPEIINGLTFSGIEWAFTHVHAANWHPLTTISHMLDCQLYGLQPWGHHLSNILLQAAAAILLFLALRKLTRSLWPSAFVAALFAIHPLRVESVAWVSERKDVLSGVFFMLTLLAYARYARSDRHSLGKYITVVALFALGLMCKPTLVTLPFVLLLLDYWPLGRMQRSEVRGRKSVVSSPWSVVRALVVEKIPLFLLSAASCVATILAQKRVLEETTNLTFAERVGNAIVSYVAYLDQTIYPAHLAVLYPYPKGNLNIAQVILSLLLLLILSAIFFLWRRKFPFLLVGWLWYLGMLVPMIGLIQVGAQTRADRYTYLPQIGLCILLAWGAIELFARWRRGREILAAAALLIVIALAMDARSQTAFWQNSETLWRHALDNTSNNYIACNNLGEVLAEKGQVDQAIVYFRRAIELNGEYAQAHNNLGGALMLKGELPGNGLPQTEYVEEAMAHYQRALQIKPDYAEAESNLGNILFGKGQVEEAIAHYQKALEIDPNYAKADYNLGIVLLKTGRASEAIAYYQKALEIKPDFAEADYNLGRALAAEGKWNEAIAACQAALRIRPDYARAYNNMGCFLVRLNKPEEALKQFAQALRIDANYPEAHFNMGCVLAQLGHRDEAVAEFVETLRLEPDYTDAKQHLHELGAPVAP
ncbi:MAG: tetratricopeptide repeat protein [Chthoniobacterales bacterium]